jgi:hypothetical protein
MLQIPNGVIAKIKDGDWSGFLSEMAGKQAMESIPFDTNTDAFKVKFVKGLYTSDPSFYSLWPTDSTMSTTDLGKLITDVNTAIKTFNFLGREDVYGDDYTKEEWRGKTRLEVLINVVGAYEYAGVGEREVLAEDVITAVDELVSTNLAAGTGATYRTLDKILNTRTQNAPRHWLVGTKNSDDYPICKALNVAFTQLKANVKMIRDAAVIAKEQAQMKRMLIRLNELELTHRYWRSDPAEQISLLQALDALKDDKNVEFGEKVKGLLGKVWTYVNKYRVEGSFYSEWTNCTAYSITASYTPKTVSSGGAVVVSKLVQSLQSQYAGWQRKAETKDELLKALHRLLNNDANRTLAATDLDNYYTSVSSVTTVNNAEAFLKVLYKKIYQYDAVDRQRTPRRCTPEVTGAVEDFVGLPIQETTKDGQTTKRIMILTPVREIKEFTPPSQDAIGTGNWETARLILENIGVKGEDLMENYLEKQREALRDRVNVPGKDGYFRVAQILDEIDQWVDRYKVLTGTTNNQITQALAKWYNAVVDYVGQFIGRDLENYVNDNVSGTIGTFEEIGNAKDAAGAEVKGSNWKIAGAAAAADDKSRLRHITVGKTLASEPTTMTTSYLYADTSTTDPSLKELKDFQSGFLTNNKLKTTLQIGMECDELTMLQNYVTNSLKQYVDLQEAEKRSYNSTSIRAYVQALKGAVEALNTAKGTTFPAATKAVLGNGTTTVNGVTTARAGYIGDLENLDNGFKSMEMLRQVDEFYEWFINLEKLNYDWRINGRSLEKMTEQLGKIKEIQFGILMPRPIGDEKDLRAENIEIRSSTNIEAMMGQLSSAVRGVNTIIASLTGSNKLTNGSFDSILKENGGTGCYITDARGHLAAADTAKEFWTKEDYFTYKDILDQLAKLMKEFRDFGTGNVVPLEKIKEWKSAMASSDIVLQAADANSLYFDGELIDHIDALIAHLKKYDLAVSTTAPNGATEFKAWLTTQWQRLTQRYGSVGDCDRDSIAVIDFMNKQNQEIELEFGSNRARDRGSELLAGKVSGKAVQQEVKLVTEDIDRCRKYHQSWLDFEKNASFLVGNFLIQNETTLIQDPNRAKADSDTGKAVSTVMSSNGLDKLKAIMKGTDAKCKSLLDLYSLYQPNNESNDDYEKLVYDLNLLAKECPTEIDYDLPTPDLRLDCVKVYKEIFIDEASPFQQLQTYVAEQNAYTEILNCERYLFETYEDWRGNAEQGKALRGKLTDLKGAALYMQPDRSWLIENDPRPAVNEGATVTTTIKRSSEVKARVVVNGYEVGDPVEVMGSNGEKLMEKESNLGEYLTQLIEETYAYNPNDNPEAIYISRLGQIDAAVLSVLDAGDHTSLFDIGADRLVPGGPLIDADGGGISQMQVLINTLEDLVQAWNRQDGTTQKKVFDGMNPDGVYFSVGDGEYVYQGEKVEQDQYPKEGIVKTVTGEGSLFETCQGGAVKEAVRKPTVKNRIMTNELLSVIDSLKSIYVNGDAIANVSEIFYQLQMAEYVYAVAGKEAKGVKWHKPSRAYTDGDKFLGKNGCYTFKMAGRGTGPNGREEDAWFICGVADGRVKVVRGDKPGDSIISNGEVNGTTLGGKTLLWFGEQEDLQGIFYQVGGDNMRLSNVVCSFTADGVNYTAQTGGIFDANGNAVGSDEDGFLLGVGGKRLTTARQGSGTTAYRLDSISQELLTVKYNVAENKEIAGGPLERYRVRFAQHDGLFSRRAKYLVDEETHGLFWEKLGEIGTGFNEKYDAWKRTLAMPQFQAAAEKIAPKVAEFATMFAALQDKLGRHDVERYNDSLAYEDEQAMLRRVNTLLQNLNGDGDMEKFYSVVAQGKEYYTLLQELAQARMTGDIEKARQKEKSMESEEQEYINAQLDAAKGKGNLWARIRSLNKELGEVEGDLKYNLSVAAGYNERAVQLTYYIFLGKLCRAAEQVKLVVSTVDAVSQEMVQLVKNYGTQKAFERVALLIEEGNSEQSENRILSMAEIWGVEKDLRMCHYEGWRGDSRDAELYNTALRAFKEWKYFAKAEEKELVGAKSVREYIEEMGTALDLYTEELRKYEAYQGIVEDVYVMDIVEDKRGKKIAGLGFEALLKAHRNWEVQASRKAAFVEGLYRFSKDLDRIIGTYDRNGEREGEMDKVLLQKIKNFRSYVGTKGDGTEKGGNRRSYIGRVEVFKPYDADNATKAQYLYKIQSTELKEIMEPYRAQELNFEAYKERIDALEPKADGPLNDYIEQLQDYLGYTQQLEIYQRSLLPLVPKAYACYNKEWVEAAGLTAKQIEDCGGIYYRLIYGYGKNGSPIFLEDYDPSDTITDAVYIGADTLWHGDYEAYGVMFRLMAILYEKFTTQKNLLADLLKEIQENNAKVAEANGYMSKVNKVQAQAAKQGEKARVIIPVDVIMYFQKKKIRMPNEVFDNMAEIGIYENSNFNQRLSYLESGDMFIENALTYLGQGLLKGKKESAENVMLSDLTNRDILELGTFKEMVDKVDFWKVDFSSLCDKEYTNQAKKWCMIIGGAALTIMSGGVLGALGGVALMAAGISKMVQDKKGPGADPGGGLFDLDGFQKKKYPSARELMGDPSHNLLKTYYLNRSRVKRDYPDSDVKGCLDAFTQGVINTMDGDTQPSPFPDTGIVGNQTGHNGSLTNGFQLNDWAAATNDWSSCAQYSYLAGAMGDASGHGKGYFKDHPGNARLLESFDLFAHQKYFGRDKGIKENLTEPDYDYDAILMMYKMEALARVFDEGVLGVAMGYLLGDLKESQTIDALDAMGNPEREKQGLIVYDGEQIKQMKAYIGGEALFTDDEDIPVWEKKPLTQLWTEQNDVKGVLNKLYGGGSSGLNADEVSLWSENLRMHIDKITTEGQTLSTKMQRMMQRCNETTSLATQMLKSIGDVWKQICANIR